MRVPTHRNEYHDGDTWRHASLRQQPNKLNAFISSVQLTIGNH